MTEVLRDDGLIQAELGAELGQLLGVAWLPRISSAGSPGSTRSAMKTMVTAPQICKSAWARRRPRNPVIGGSIRAR